MLKKNQYHFKKYDNTTIVQSLNFIQKSKLLKTQYLNSVQNYI